MSIPEHVTAIIVCGSDLSEADLVAHIEGQSVVPWFLSEQTSIAAFAESAVNSGASFALDLLEVEGSIEDVRFFEVSRSGVVQYAVLAVPASRDVDFQIPTGALQKCARAWPVFPGLVNDLDVSDIPDLIRGKICIFSVDGVSASDKELITPCLISLAGHSLLVGRPKLNLPDWTNASLFDLDNLGLVVQPLMMAGQLLQEIVAERRVRWRYISFYRVMESAYLLGLKEALVASFMANPKQALDQARTALDSELSTFQKLVSDKNLTIHFERILAVVDGDGTNRFLHAIKRSLRDSKLAGAQKGVAYAYKIRCAIIHAGQHDVVFDRFSDAEDGVGLLLGDLEAAVLDLIGLKIV